MANKTVDVYDKSKIDKHRLETYLADGKPIRKSTHCGLTKDEMVKEYPGEDEGTVTDGSVTNKEY